MIMKKYFSLLLLLFFFITGIFAQQTKPSKEQIEKDKKAYADAQQKLNETLSKMSPEARKSYDSMMNAMGMGQKMEQANKTVANAGTAKSAKITSAGLVNGVPAKDSKKITTIASTPATAGMGAFIGTSNSSIFSVVFPSAKNKANEIYQALKKKNATADEMGNAATALWMTGRTQIALCVMAQICNADASNSDNLNNYASMLTMMELPEMAIPILNNLNSRFKKNTTLLNNLGQAWFALGDMDKANKYLDSTLLLNAGHAQANETKSLIAESKGNKTAALAHAKAAFKHGATSQRKNRLSKLGYIPGASDYGNFPPLNKADDLLQLGGFVMPAFPKSVAECRALAPIWKQFRSDIDQQIKPLQKITESSNALMVKQLEEQQKQFMNAKNKAISNPGSVSAAEAMQIIGAPLFSEEMNARENIVLQNLQKKKQATLQRISEFKNGDGAALKKKYQDAMAKIQDRWKNVGEGGSENNEVLCRDAVKASDEFLLPYNSKLEELYKEYLSAEKQLINEISYSSLYTTYAKVLPGINAGLKMQWLRALSLTQNGFNFESITNYSCTDDAEGKAGKLTAFKDPNCNIKSEFGQQLGIANLGFNIKLDCDGISTEFNALILGFKLNQDLDHEGFGDSFKSCTVSVGPKVSAGGKVGPLEASVNVGGGADIEIDRTGIKDVIVKVGAEIEAGVHNPGIPDPGQLGTAASGSAGIEGRMSLNTGAGSIQGTGIFK